MSAANETTTPEHVSQNAVTLNRLRKLSADSCEELGSIKKLMYNSKVTATKKLEDMIAGHVKKFTKISKSCGVIPPRGVGSINGNLRARLGDAVEDPHGRDSDLKEIYPFLYDISVLYHTEFKLEVTRLEALVAAEKNSRGGRGTGGPRRR